MSCLVGILGTLWVVSDCETLSSGCSVVQCSIRVRVVPGTIPYVCAQMCCAYYRLEVHEPGPRGRQDRVNRLALAACAVRYIRVAVEVRPPSGSVSVSVSMRVLVCSWCRCRRRRRAESKIDTRVLGAPLPKACVAVQRGAIEL